MDNLPLKSTNAFKHITFTPQVEQKFQRFNSQDKIELAGATQDFEAMMNTMMLKSMSEAAGGFFGDDGYGNDVFESMFLNELGGFFSRKGNLGIAEMMYKKITGEEFPAELLNNSFSKGGLNGVDYTKVSNDTKLVTPSNSSLERLGNFDSIVKEASKTFGVDEKLIKAIILAESAGNPKALSKANAKGLMQLIDSTAEDMGVENVWDPKQNIFGGTKYIAKMLKKYGGDLEKSLAAYNAGPHRVDKYNGIPPFKETKSYIARVKGYLKYLEN